MNPIRAGEHQLLIAGANLPGGIDSITTLIQENVISLVLTVVAVFALFLARRGEVSTVLTMVIAVVFGLFILVFAIPESRDAIITWLSNTFT